MRRMVTAALFFSFLAWTWTTFADPPKKIEDEPASTSTEPAAKETNKPVTCIARQMMAMDSCLLVKPKPGFGKVLAVLGAIVEGKTEKKGSSFQEECRDAETSLISARNMNKEAAHGCYAAIYQCTKTCQSEVKDLKAKGAGESGSALKPELERSQKAIAICDQLTNSADRMTQQADEYSRNLAQVGQCLGKVTLEKISQNDNEAVPSDAKTPLANSGSGAPLAIAAPAETARPQIGNNPAALENKADPTVSSLGAGGRQTQILTQTPGRSQTASLGSAQSRSRIQIPVPGTRKTAANTSITNSSTLTIQLPSSFAKNGNLQRRKKQVPVARGVAGLAMSDGGGGGSSSFGDNDNMTFDQFMSRFKKPALGRAPQSVAPPMLAPQQTVTCSDKTESKTLCKDLGKEICQQNEDLEINRAAHEEVLVATRKQFVLNHWKYLEPLLQAIAQEGTKDLESYFPQLISQIHVAKLKGKWKELSEAHQYVYNAWIKLSHSRWLEADRANHQHMWVLFDHARSALYEGVRRSELSAKDKQTLQGLLASVRLHDPSSQRDADRFYAVACGSDVAGLDSVIYEQQTNTLFICPFSVSSVRFEGEKLFTAVLHELSHSIDSYRLARLNEPLNAYAHYFSCLEENQGAILRSHAAFEDRERVEVDRRKEVSADLWTTRAIASFNWPIEVGPDHSASSKSLRRAYRGICSDMGGEGRPPGVERLKVFSQDAQVRSRLSCTHSCQAQMQSCSLAQSKERR